MKNKEKVIWQILIFVLALAISGLFFYISNLEVPYNSDDAGTPLAYYYLFEKGTKTVAASIWSINSIIDILSYKLYGLTAQMSYCGFVIRYVLNTFIGLLFIWNKEKKLSDNVLSVSLFLLMIIHPSYIIRWHFTPQFFMLLIALIEEKCEFTKRIKLILYFLLFVWSIANNDILVFISCWIPLVLLYICKESVYREYDYRKYCLVLLVLAIGLIIATIFFSDYQYQGYGSYVGLKWPTVQHVLTMVGFFIEGILTLFDSYAAGSDAISVFSFPLLIKLLAICIGLVYSIKDVVLCVAKRKEVGISFFFSVGIWIQLIAAMFNGEERVLTIRYASSIFWSISLLVVLLISKMIDCQESKLKLTLSALFLSVVFSLQWPLQIPADNDLPSDIQEYLCSEGNYGTKYGLATFWNSNVNSVQTEGKAFIQSVTKGDSSLFTDIQTYEEYKEGTNYFNFLILGAEEVDAYDGWMNENYGQEIEKKIVGNYSILSYDYDIRKKPQEIIHESVSLEINEEKRIGVINSLTGKNIIELEMEEIAEVSVWIKDSNGNRIDLNLEKTEGNKKRYSFEYIGNDEIDVFVTNDTNQNVVLKKCQHKFESFSKKIEKNDEEEYFELQVSNGGVFTFSIIGDDVKHMNLQVFQNDNRVDVETICNGKKKVSYRVLLETGNVKIKCIDKNETSLFIETPYEIRENLY